MKLSGLIARSFFGHTHPLQTHLRQLQALRVDVKVLKQASNPCPTKIEDVKTALEGLAKKNAAIFDNTLTEVDTTIKITRETATLLEELKTIERTTYCIQDGTFKIEGDISSSVLLKE